MGTTMRTPRIHARSRGRAGQHAQRGVIMIFTLIALVLMLIAVAAMVRSTGTATSVIGNLSFRRDLTNRAEVAISVAKTALNTSTLDTTTDSVASHYLATRSAAPTTGSFGAPTLLLSDSAYNSAGYTCMGGTGAILADCNTPGTDGVVIRWIIDRQCVTGTTTFDKAACDYLTSTKDAGGSAQNANRKPSGAGRPIYRISVRVHGPRNNESYIQATAG